MIRGRQKRPLCANMDKKKRGTGTGMKKKRNEEYKNAKYFWLFIGAMGDRLSGLHTDSNGVFLVNFIYKLEWAFCN